MPLDIITIDSDDDDGEVDDEFLKQIELAIERSVLSKSSTTTTAAAATKTSTTTTTTTKQTTSSHEPEVITIDSDSDWEDYFPEIPKQPSPPPKNRPALGSSDVTNRSINPWTLSSPNYRPAKTTTTTAATSRNHGQQNRNQNNRQELVSPGQVNNRSITSVIDPRLELIDPAPELFRLFREFDDKFFYHKLQTKPIVVDWSNTYTSCAGAFSTIPGRPGSTIKISAKLMSLLPRAELVNTLLHEMIHAYVFYIDCRELGRSMNYRPHGPQFQHHMDRINRAAGTNITIYHSHHQQTEYLNRNKRKNLPKPYPNHPTNTSSAATSTWPPPQPSASSSTSSFINRRLPGSSSSSSTSNIFTLNDFR